MKNTNRAKKRNAKTIASSKPTTQNVMLDKAVRNELAKLKIIEDEPYFKVIKRLIEHYQKCGDAKNEKTNM